MCRSYQIVSLKRPIIFVLVFISVFGNIQTSLGQKEIVNPTESIKTEETDEGNLLKSSENSLIVPTMANVDKVNNPYSNNITSKVIDEESRNRAMNEMFSQNESVHLHDGPQFKALGSIEKATMLAKSSEQMDNEGTTMTNFQTQEETPRDKVISSSDDSFLMQRNMPAQDINKKLVTNIDTNGKSRNQLINISRITNRLSTDLFDVERNSTIITSRESKALFHSEKNASRIGSRQSKDLFDGEDESETGSRKKYQEVLLNCRTNFSLDLTFDNVETWELKCILRVSSQIRIVIAFEGVKEKKFFLEFASSENDYRSTRDEDNLTPICIPVKQYHSVCLYFDHTFIKQPKYVSVHPYLILGDNQEKKFLLGSLDLIMNGYVSPKHSSHNAHRHDCPKIHDFTQAIQSVKLGKYDHQPIFQYWNPHGYHGDSGYHENHSDSGNSGYYENSVTNDHGQYGHHGNEPHYSPGYHSNSVNKDHGLHGEDAHYGPGYHSNRDNNDYSHHGNEPHYGHGSHGNSYDNSHGNGISQSPGYYDESSYDHSGYSHSVKAIDSKSSTKNEGWKPSHVF